MRATDLLGEMARAGVEVSREGDDLAVDAPGDVDLGRWRPRVTVWRLALLAACDWRAAVTVAPDQFDRARADLLYARLAALERAADTQDAVLRASNEQGAA